MTMIEQIVADAYCNMPSGQYPVIFNGSEPRWIGYVTSRPDSTMRDLQPLVDNMLIGMGLSAEKLSLASGWTTGQRFVVAHG